MGEKITFNIGCNDEDWLIKVINDFNSTNGTNFKIEEMLDWEVIFAKVSTTNDVEQIFELSKFVTHYATIEFIEGKR
ncbi:hypothetical protein [Cytophaga aurantiaca]|uniref:hypothetical protein n=1 Tax=Cytophaga aurantiaca TaxID=29530 RepID=UPI00037BE9BD|nr:hypothetical protein [Cytophaga aurantiaca]